MPGCRKRAKKARQAGIAAALEDRLNQIRRQQRQAQEDLTIEAGSGIAQLLFHLTKHAASYTGKYQHQANKPVEAILA
jgi:hypothetical protein